MLDYELKTRESWNDAPRWVRDKWTNQNCVADADVMSKSCKPWISCCQMKEKYGIKNGITWGSAPQSIRNKWQSIECDQNDDIKSNSCRKPKPFGSISTYSLMTQKQYL